MPDLLLLLGRKNVHDAVNGLRRIPSVQSRENQVAGLGRCDRRRHGFEIAHFSDQNDIRVAPQRRP